MANTRLLGVEVHSHDATFSECDCVFLHRTEWVVWMSVILFTLEDCDLIKKCSRTEKIAPCEGAFSVKVPQRSWGKVMFLHVCVILFTGGSGPGGSGPRGVVPAPGGGGSPGPHPRGKLRGIRSRPTPPPMATAAGSMHPTGMHSCV